MPFNFRDIKFGIGSGDNPWIGSMVMSMTVVVTLMWLYWDCSCGDVKSRIVKASFIISTVGMILLHFNAIKASDKAIQKLNNDRMEDLFGTSNANN